MKIGSRAARNWLMFGTALCLTVYEALARQGERPALLVLYASMMGIPMLLRDRSEGAEE